MDDTSHLKRLRADFREFPATMGMGAVWVAVFVAMLADQAYSGGGVGWRSFLLGTQNGLRFGALTLRDLEAGEVWRLVTATFVHFGVIHIGLNLYALYQLGCLIESWYGPGPFFGIYLLTGGGENFLSALVRHYLRSNPGIPSGGGSTVVMGLVGLCAVAGWRMRTRTGEHLRNQMIFVIVLTGAIGVAFWAAWLPVIDNWGHAGGTAVGALIGFGSPVLLRRGRGLLANGSGWLSVGLMAACGAAQVADGRAWGERTLRQAQEVEQARRRFVSDERALLRLEEIRKVYRAVATPRAILRGMMIREVPSRPQPPPKPVPAPRGDSPGDNPHPGPGTEASSAPTRARPSPAAEVTPADSKARPAPAPEARPEPAPPTPPPPPRGTQVFLEPEQEFFLVVISSSLRSLGSLAAELDTGETSADFRRAQSLLARTLTELPTIEEIREFDERLLSIRENLKKDRDAARQRIGAGN